MGNRLSRTSTHPALANQTASYDANDRVATEQYDANGNTVGANGQGYGWDAENRLTVLNAGTASEVRYAYDGDGNRVAKTEGGVTTRYLVDTMNPTGYAQTVEELTEQPGQPVTVTRRYAYGLDLISQEQMIAGVWTASWYGYDGHGNVRSLTDAAGAVTDRYDYDAYGTLIHRDGSTPNEYLYTGERFDPALGFYYLRARYLDPNQGRFAGMDSYAGHLLEPISLHKYQYAYGNPVNCVDPSGRATTLDVLATGSITTILAGIVVLLGAIVLARVTNEIERANKTIYRDTGTANPRNPKTVALHRVVDWRTGLSFTTVKPLSGSYISYNLRTLWAAGLLVRFDGGLPSIDVHTGEPLPELGVRAQGHVAVWHASLKIWDEWYKEDTGFKGTQSVSGWTLKLHRIGIPSR